MKLLITLLTILPLLVGCASTLEIQQTLDSNGNVIAITQKMKGDSAVLYLAEKLEKQRGETARMVATWDKNAQLVYSARDGLSQNDPVEDMYIYKAKRNDTLNRFLLGAGGLMLALSTMNSNGDMQQSGDTYNIGDINQNSTPQLLAGEGGQSGSSGATVLSIGRNHTATDGASQAWGIERYYPNNSGDNDNIQDNGKILPW